MSTLYLFPPEQEPPEDSDLLAAEYAAGLLDPGDAASLRLRAEGDAALRRAVAVWQARLALLIEILPREAPPPVLWQRLAADIGLPAPRQALFETAAPPPPPPPPPPWPESDAPAVANLFARLSEKPTTVATLPADPAPHPKAPPAFVQPDFEPPAIPAPERQPAPPAPDATAAPVAPAAPQPPPWHARLLVWRIATAALLVLCLLLAARALSSGGTLRQVAAIGPPGAPAPLFLAETDAAGRLVITPLATIAVPGGHDLELWSIPANHAHAPTPLGVLPAAGATFALGAIPPEGTQLLVSMEPRGGAPGGVLTGQVLYAGTLANH